MPIIARLIAATALIVMAAEPAWAYVGPGAGLSLLAAFWALFTAILASVGFLVLWPIRQRMRRAKNAAAKKPVGAVSESGHETDERVR